MRIGGLQKLTLLDFPGRVACTVFLQGCDLRCPFCHNAGLLRGVPGISEEELLDFLRRRQGLLDGVAVTGGEPLLAPELPELLGKLRAMGFAVKLDTNGTHPAALRAVLEAGLADYVAMDIKNSPEKYAATCGRDGVLPAVRESAALLMQGRVPYEFRTTVVDELHEPEDFSAIGAWLRGAQRYYLQQFVDSGDVLEAGLHAVSEEKRSRCLAAAREWIPQTELRGV